MSAQQATRRQNGRNDQPVKTEVTPQQLAEAAAYEQGIADEAAAIWRAAASQGDVTLTPALYVQLQPLLRRPIPDGFISEVSSGKGKPYDSKGIKSMQVQIDRLDNVLTPLHWGWRTIYTENGQLATVVAWVGDEVDPLFDRSARGGINKLEYGQTVGNLYKGSETNAGKLALARLGPGHEVYVGLTDLDPDVSEEAAQAQEQYVGETVTVAEAPKLTVEQIARVERGVEAAGLSKHLANKLRSMGIDSLAEATTEHATSLYEWCHGADTAEPKGAA